MVILGIDPGLARTGYGFVRKNKDKSFSLIEFGCITTPSELRFSQRLFSVYQQTRELFKTRHPDKIAIESLYFAKNTKTAFKVGQVRGVILLASYLEKVKIEEFTPLEVKMALTGYGRASKSQVQQMVKKFLGLKEIPKPDDAADALAVAIVCGQTLSFSKPCV
ncbi:crossover junction endodeoxyribonuclease RuvC [bacterium]|nr:crossover junction endodeoxyribonuclease RuvC [bacterium]